MTDFQLQPFYDAFGISQNDQVHLNQKYSVVDNKTLVTKKKEIFNYQLENISVETQEALHVYIQFLQDEKLCNATENEEFDMDAFVDFCLDEPFVMPPREGEPKPKQLSSKKTVSQFANDKIRRMHSAASVEKANEQDGAQPPEQLVEEETSDASNGFKQKVEEDMSTMKQDMSGLKKDVSGILTMLNSFISEMKGTEKQSE